MKPWVVCLCTLSFTACLSSSRSPEARFYQLQPVRMEVEDVSFPYDGVLVDDVETAEYLDRPQMVVRQGEHRLDYLEFDRWAEPLDENFADVLVANLASCLGSETPVGVNARDGEHHVRVQVRVVRFEGDPERGAILEAVYGMEPMGWTERVRLRTEVKGETLEAVVSAQSRLVGDLAREMARRLSRIDESS